MAKIEYLGGFPFAARSGKCTLIVGGKRLHFSLGGLSVLGTLNTWGIPYTDIRSAQAMTEEQVRHDVTLTRLLLVGVAAFAIKKRRTESTAYLTVDCIIGGNEYSLLFKTANAHKMAAMINLFKSRDAQITARKAKRKAAKKNEANKNRDVQIAAQTSEENEEIADSGVQKLPMAETVFSVSSAILGTFLALVVALVIFVIAMSQNLAAVGVVAMFSPVALIPLFYKYLKARKAQ